MNRKIQLLEYPLGIVLFSAGAYFADHHMSTAAVICFALLAVSECLLIFSESRNIIDLRLLLTLSWIIGIMLASLKLSARQNDWSPVMWLSAGGFYFAYLAAYELIHCRTEKTPKKERQTAVWDPCYMKRVKESIYIVAGLGLAAFLAESVKFRFAWPILVNNTPHAYTSFHISGVHYFVVSLMFVHALSVIYLIKGRPERKERTVLLVINAVCFLVPILLLSKFQILISLAMPLVICILIQKRFSVRQMTLIVIAAGVIMLLSGVLIIAGRDYPEGYLENIFDFKNRSTPLSVQYPYMYIVNNFENVNLLTLNLQRHSYGIRQLFPVFALTGTKFLPGVQNLLALEQYLTCPELTTLSIIYDAYGDFGMIGVWVFGILVGAFSAWTDHMVHSRAKVLGVLLYAQLAVYMTLSFFTTWFSNATTWFWFIATFFIALWCTKEKGKLKFSMKELAEEFT